MSVQDARYRHVVFEGVKTARAAVRTPETPPPRDARPVRVRREVEPIEAERRFLQGVLSSAGLDIEGYRWAPLVRRIPACLRALRTDSLEAASAAIGRSPSLLLVAIDALIIGVTSFFRDPAVFRCLQEQLIPELSGRRLDVWSAGCSDGAELYSMAMLLLNAGALPGLWLGTDCRPEAIEQARRGCFTAEMAAAVPGELRQRWLSKRSREYVVVASLRQMTRWRVADVLHDHGASRWDIILCRNLTIYMRMTAAERLWRRLAEALRPGGLLVVGKAERPPRRLGLTQVGPCLFRKEGNGS